MSDTLLENTLAYDPIENAEKRYGKIGESNEALLHAIEELNYKREQVKSIMLSRNDTYSDMTSDDYLKVVENNNFRKLIEEDFYDRDGSPNKYFVFWHSNGTLLTLDTFTWFGKRERTINSAQLYYNIEMTAHFKEWIKKTASGCCHWSGPITSDDRYLTNIWVGYHDVRDGLMYKMYGLAAVGKFKTEWVDSDQIYLSHYMDRLHSVKDFNERSIILKEDTIARFNKMGYIGKMLLKARGNRYV
jgi:hypothetical protein